ncbi:reverse transcriptase [Cucumis melo var. makuwa]|uniref:Reverse transcriptase n=1 Tax=Cucumis melo var. makuwa TaxID=1194695 RepID=A0A5D3DRC5_CUCMM|nr:reverse transcriptase [Cucumis melo var. makuwa]
MTGLMLLFFKNVEEKNSGDKTEDKEETSNNEVKQGRARKLDEYDPFLDIHFALRKGTMSCTKHSVCNYVSSDNLSPQFRAFTARIDSTIIPKNIHAALECPKWKNAIMEEMKAFEKKKLWRFVLYPRDTKLWDVNGCSLSNTKQREHLTDTRPDQVEEVYMSPPPRFEVQFGQQKIYSDYCTFVWGNLITWRSKKQSVVARNSAEAKYQAMSLGICEELWLQKFLSDLY